MTIEDSVVLITSPDADNRSFGTGFVIHSDGGGDYVMTCRHVVEHVAAETHEGVCINYHRYSLIDLYMNKSDDPDDMAVLKIAGSLAVPPLPVAPAVNSGISIRIYGHYLFSKPQDIHRKLPVDGVLGERGVLNFRSRIGRMTTWDLEIEGRRTLQEGYSGAPVIHEGAVVGVVSHKLQRGEVGVAVCIRLIEEIWKDAPAAVISPSKKPTIRQKVDPRACDRDREDICFRDFFNEYCRECPPTPHFYILPGEAGECHASFVKRLRDTRIKPFIDSLIRESGRTGHATNRPYDATVPWKITPDMRSASRSYTLREAFHQAFFNTDPPDPSLSLTDMFRKLGAMKNKVVLFTHNIHAEQWDERMTAWYITEFWKQGFVCREDEEVPLFLIFMNLVYPESDRQGGMERFLWHRFRRKRIRKTLNRLKASCKRENCRLLIFEDLEGITKQHVSDWFDRFGKDLLQQDRLDLIYTLFKDRPQVCMMEIEKKLITVVDEYLREQSGLHKD